MSQKTRWSDAELELIRNTFSGEGEKLLYYIRNVFLQLPNEAPKDLSPEVIGIVRKQMLPQLSIDAPLKMQADLAVSLSMIKDLPLDAAILRIKAWDIAKEYLKQQFDVLTGGNEEKIRLSDLLEKGEKTDAERFIDLFAWQILANGYVEDCLLNLSIMAKPVETADQETARLKANSTK